MYLIYFLRLLLLLWCKSEANHFRGGTITWKPINNNVTGNDTISIMITQTYTWTLSQVGCNNSMIAAQSPPVDFGTKAGNGANLMCNATCSTSGGYVGHEVPITGYCTDFSTALDATVSQRFDIVNLTAGAHFTVTFSTNGGWQSLALGNSTGWSLSSLIDVRVRPDNGLINTPPVATCISYLTVPVNIQHTIQIPVLDADNDYLRCRFANGSSECVNACPPGSLPMGTTLSSSCVLTITGTTPGDYYLVAIQVEDFITNTSTTPLSSVPLQFLIYVYGTTNCTLKPLLIADSNKSGCQGAQVGVNFTMTLTVINQCGNGRTITEIATLSFPIIMKSALVQNATNTSLWSMEITWIPTANQVGSQVLCAVAIDNASVQSNQYCATLFIGLTSVPTCPGMIIAPTTVVTTMETSTSLITETSEQQVQYSTEFITTMDMTSASNVATSMSMSSPLLSSTVKPNNTVNLSLIVGLSVLALALAVCWSLCCWYFVFGFKCHRRSRKKKNDLLQYGFEWSQVNVKFPKEFFKGKSQKQNYDLRQGSSVTIINDSRTPSGVTVSRVNRKKSRLIDNKGNIKNKQLSRNCVDFLPDSILTVNVQGTDGQDEIRKVSTLVQAPNNNLMSIRSVLQDSRDSITLLSAALAKRNRFTFMKLPRFSKSAVEPCQSKSRIGGKMQPKATQHISLNKSAESEPIPQPWSSVSARRIERS